MKTRFCGGKVRSSSVLERPVRDDNRVLSEPWDWRFLFPCDELSLCLFSLKHRLASTVHGKAKLGSRQCTLSSLGIPAVSRKGFSLKALGRA